jgi:hypothetical protein
MALPQVGVAPDRSPYQKQALASVKGIAERAGGEQPLRQLAIEARLDPTTLDF